MRIAEAPVRSADLAGVTLSELPFAGLIERARQSPGPAWLRALRETGAESFAATGLPHPRNEEWRFTPLTGMASVDWTTAGQGTVTAETLQQFEFETAWPRIVMVDGRYSPELSRLGAAAEGVTVMSLADAIETDHPAVEANLARHATPDMTPFTSLSAAMISDGLFVHVAASQRPSTPVHMLHVTTGSALNALLSPRILTVVESGAELSLVEDYVSLTGATYFNNVVAEIVLGENARVEHSRLERESDAAWHVGFTQVDQARDSHYRSFALAMGGRLNRHNLHASLNGTNVETLLYGLYLTRGEQIADTHSAIHHDHPNCNSWEVYKGVLADRSRAVFNGKVLVDRLAQKTDAKQTNRNLLLSDTAKVDTKPQLEIFADDVKCTHGATIGKLDPQQRFYLRSRGIAGQKAEQLLIWAFAGEVLTEVPQREVRLSIGREVQRRLVEMTS